MDSQNIEMTCQDRCSCSRLPSIVSLGKYIVLVIFSILSVAETNPIKTTPEAMMYLSQFGYISPMNPTSGAIMDEATVKNAISEFQSFAGLEATGDLDEETVKTMSLPRCGVKDRVGFGSNSRSKRYALQGSRWKVKDLTYKISKYPSRSKMTKAEVDSEIARAFNVWSDYTDLTFTQVPTGQVHIEIRFEKGEHGDGDPFDGQGGTLAHAYFPVYGGDAHFDDEEQWTMRSMRGSSLFQVAAHEFGHSLGLSHSDVKSSLMAPFYRGYQSSFSLDIDDINGIQKLYGKKTSNKPTSHPIYPTFENEKLCSDSKIDTIFNNAEGETFIFKGEVYYKLTENSVEPGYPRLISKTWRGLPNNIDAAFTFKNGKSYFFKGSKYWRFVGTKMDGDYPKEISEGFAGIPDNIDTAFVWSGNGKIYFFKGEKFWRFDPSARPPVKITYPKPISNWEGVPNNVDAAFQYTNGYTYFFKNGAYYRFNDRTFSVDRADPAFPRSTAYWWLGCKSAPSGTVQGKDFYTEERPTDEGFDDSDVLDAGGSDERDDKLDNRNSSFKIKQSVLATLLISIVLYLIH